ncbi:MAG: TldD/PmbA family protein [Bacteroidales bacterium]|nr:TldD/PmbA family protein [Bacteroidales bacterium]MBN2819446.1 TldD/PmbA family protein [Bacteroidales bacterium]
MNKEMLDLCNWIMDETLKNGASDCKVSLNKRRIVEINYRKQKPESIKEATTRSLSLDVYLDGKFAVQSTPDLRKTSLETFIKKACENAKYIEADPYRTLPGKDLIKGKQDIDLELYDNRVKDFAPDLKHKMVQEIEEACINKGGDKVISVEAGAEFSEDENLEVASNGLVNSTQKTSVWIGASMAAQDEGDRRPNGYHWAGARYLNDLPKTSDVGIKAAERTLELLGGKKMPTEKLPVIIENRVANRLLNGFIAGMNGGNIQQQRSFLADKKGEVVASPKLSLIDDPFVKKGFGSRLVDGDGLPARKRIMLDQGKVEEFFIDWYYSRKMECQPTTGGASNLILKPGEKSLEDLMKDTGRGILVTGFIGGNSNSTTGDFSIGIIGHLFENGVPVQAIAEMNIADNHLEFWKKLADVGNDPWKYSSWNIPSLLFDDIVVAGV